MGGKDHCVLILRVLSLSSFCQPLDGVGCQSLTSSLVPVPYDFVEVGYGLLWQTRILCLILTPSGIKET